MEPGGIIWSGDDGDMGTAAGEKSGDVDHGDHMALGQEGNYNKVGLNLINLAAAGGSHRWTENRGKLRRALFLKPTLLIHI